METAEIDPTTIRAVYWGTRCLKEAEQRLKSLPAADPVRIAVELAAASGLAAVHGLMADDEAGTTAQLLFSAYLEGFGAAGGDLEGTGL